MITTYPRGYRLLIILIVLLALGCAWWWPLPLHASLPIPSVHAAAQIRFDASVTRTEFAVGDRLQIDGYLFNDGDSAARGWIAIEPPAGFVALSGTTSGGVGVPGQVEPGHPIHASFWYRVTASTPVGLATFRVFAYDDTGTPIPGLRKDITIRVCCIPAPPAIFHGYRVYLPVVR